MTAADSRVRRPEVFLMFTMLSLVLVQPGFWVAFTYQGMATAPGGHIFCKEFVDEARSASSSRTARPAA